MGLIETLESIFSAIARVNSFFILLALLAVAGNVLFLCLRWKFSLDIIVGSPKLRGLFPILLGSFFFNNITPIRGFGGEPYRIYAGKKRLGVAYDDGLASVVAERVLETISLAILLVTCFMVAIYRHTISSHIYGLIGTSVGVMVSLSLFIYIFLYKKPHLIQGLVVKLVHRFGVTKKRTKAFFSRLKLSTSKVFTNFKACIKVSGCSLAKWLCDLAKYTAILAALGVWLSPELIMIAFAISMVAGVIPSPGGLGGFDLTLGGLLAAFGVPFAAAFAAVLINRGISYLPLTVAGFIAVSHMHLPFRRR